MPVLITNVRLIDGLGRPPLQQVFVAVEHERIAECGPMSDLDLSCDAGVLTIDALGYSLTPGLIDAHAHLVYAGYSRLADLDFVSPETAAIDAVINAQAVLEAGFTSVRDVGTIGNTAVALRDAIRAGKVVGPRLVASGRIITTTSGPAHPLVLARPDSLSAPMVPRKSPEPCATRSRTGST